VTLLPTCAAAAVQVMVETALGKEELKEAVLMCTNRVS
jgi:hypothetical protein